MEYTKLLNDQEMLTKTRNINFVSKVVKFHRLCKCWYQERVENMQNNNNLKSNSVQSTSRQNYDCYLSRDVYAEAFKTNAVLLSLLSKRKKYITLTILIIMIKKFYMN